MAPRSKNSKDAYYFSFYAKDWRSSESVGLMSLAERGAFIELLAVSWLSSEEPCTIPAGDAEIASLLRIPVEEWRAIAPRVLAQFDVTTERGRLRNEKLWTEYQLMRREHRKKSQGGKTSALRRRDDHGRLLPREHQDSTKTLSGSLSHSQSQVTTTTAAPKRQARDKAPSWLVPVCAVWERHKGAGSFKWPKAGALLKPLHDAGHSGDAIAANLARYIPKAGRFVSLARFAETYADHDEIRLIGPPVVDGWMSPEVERLTRPEHTA